MADVPRVGPFRRVHRSRRGGRRGRLGGELGPRAKGNQRPRPHHGKLSGVGGAEDARERLDPTGHSLGGVQQSPAVRQRELERDDSLGIVAGIDAGQLDEAANQKVAPYGQNQGDSDLERD